MPWALGIALDLDGLTWHVPAAVAFLPYVVVFTLGVLAAALLTRTWIAVIAAAAGLLLLAAPRLDRIGDDPQPAAGGPIVTVATANVLVGGADPAWLTRFVRDQRIDILAIQENTPQWDRGARQAGLGRILPYGRAQPDPRPGAAGLALWSRWPVTRERVRGDDGRSLGGIVTVPGAATPVHVRSVHPYPPFANANIDCWRRCTRALGRAADATGDAILAGDFNATLDHHPLRDVLAAGYRDAAAETGDAWRPTWTNGRWAALTIDHILATRRIAIRSVTVHDLAGSDHDVVVARVRLPR